MENFFPPLSTNTGNTTNTTKTKMGCSQDSQFSSIYGPFTYPSPSLNLSSPPQSYCYPPQYNMPTPLEILQFPCTISLDQAAAPTPYPTYPFWLGSQNGIEMQDSGLVQRNGLLIDQERRALDAYKTKVARCKRKLARQMSLSKLASSGPNSTHVDTTRLALNGANVQNSNPTINRDLYKFFTPDNKRLRVLLRKELKNSDVGSLGRIVLPKREAEENLPILTDKEGILVMIKDIYSNQEWGLKFKYWSNNKSRMYVLENTGEFVRQNGLEMADSFTLYEDESKNLYFSIKKVEKPVGEPKHEQHSSNDNQNYLYLPHNQAKEEEETSLALLIDQLTHKEQEEEANSLVTLPMDVAASNRYNPEASTGPSNNVTSITTFPQQAGTALQLSSSPQGKMRMTDDHHSDDCYAGLGMLPDVYWYNFSL